MDRLHKRLINSSPWIVVATALVLATPASLGGTKFLSPSAAVDPSGEKFPESRWGSPPAKVDAGRENRYQALLDEEEGLRPPESTAPGRAPAGLEFAKPSRPSAPAGAPAAPSMTVETVGEGVNYEVPEAPHKVEMESVRGSWSGSNELSKTSDAITRGIQEVALIASDLGFFPKTVFVARDVPVRLFVTGSSKNTLCIMMDSFQVRRQVRSQKIEEVVFTPNVPGKYRFYCPVNGMEGTLVVKELTSAVE